MLAGPGGRPSIQTRRTFAKQALFAALATTRLLRAQAVFTGPASLRAHAAARGLLTGAAVNVSLLATDPTYARTLAAQYNIVVAENAMKWAALHPGPQQFDFTQADRFVQFAQAHAMQIRGHNLCWHLALPPWFASTVNQANAEQFLTTHIATVAGRYRGQIRAWDVVNEAIEPKDGLPGGLRNSPWYRLLGPRYLDIAFRAARVADPSALLTYNDYGIETETPAAAAKRAAVLALIQRLQRDRVPIDAVGIQSHLSTADPQPGPGLTRFVQQAAALGLKVFLTELDVNDDSLPTGASADARAHTAATDATPSPNPADTARATRVAAIYRDYVTLLLRNPAVTDVLTWGVSDNKSWLNAPGAGFRPRHPLREELCLPFNDAYQPNPAFFALRAALDSRRT